MFDTSNDRRRIKRRIKQRKKRRKKRQVKRIWVYIPILMVSIAVSVFSQLILIENFEDGSKKPIADFIRSSTQYDIHKKQLVAVVKEVHTQDTNVKEAFASVRLQTVNYKKVEEEMEENEKLLKKDRTSDLKQSLDKKIATVNNEYYVQAGSWRNYKYTEMILIKLKKYYPDVYIVEQNNFYKVRIPGVKTKKQGTFISKDMEEKFNMKPLLVLKIHNVSLDAAVRPFIGTSYTKINCYGLIVRGLINQGVQYHGYGGLREKLENLAKRNGLPNNAYLNGEGLVEKAGTQIFSKSVFNISNAHEKSNVIYSGLTQYLQEGLILSFSTPTRGHTGIVSKQEDDWTYINSGVIDNPIFPGEVSERVGEEFLKAEIANWFVIAASRMEPLMVTLGRIDVNQLQDLDGPNEKNKITALNIY
jgi:hypothetical protein